MSISPLKLEETSGAIHETLSAIKGKIGMIPNLYAVMAKAPAVLNNTLTATENLQGSSLGAKTGELIALAVSNANGCGYCVSAHTAIGGRVGIDAGDLAEAQLGRASDPKTQAVLTLALEFNAHHGHGPDTAAAVQAARNAGLNEQEILEVVGHVAANVLNNTVNGISDTEIDFPKVDLR